MRSVKTFSQLNPLLNLNFFLLTLNIIHDLSKQLIHYLLGRIARLLFCCLHRVFVVCLVLAQVETSNHVVEGILGLGSKDQSVNTVNYLSESQGWTIVSVENGMADTALRVHIAMVDRSNKSHLRSFERIISRKLGIE